MLSLTSVILTATVLAAPIDVRSNVQCPSAKDVAEQLQPLVPAWQETDVATVEVFDARANSAAAVHLELLRHGSVLGDRHLVLQGDCQSKARTVATVIAAWEGAPNIEIGDAPAMTVRMPADSAPSGWQTALGAGLSAAWIGGIAAGGSLEVLVGRRASHWQLRLGLQSETSREQELATGRVAWRHTGVAAGAAVRSLTPSWLLSLDAGASAGWVDLRGNGYAEDLPSRSFDYGLVAAARAGKRFSRWTVWAEVRGRVWLRVQRASLAGASDSVDLPATDVMTAVGASVVLFE